MEALLDGEAEAITRKVIELALDGEPAAIRLCLDRLAPPRRDRPLTFAMPALDTAEDVAKAGRLLMRAVAEGEITPTEAADVMKLFEGLSRTIEIADLERRLRVLEEAPDQNRGHHHETDRTPHH